MSRPIDGKPRPKKTMVFDPLRNVVYHDNLHNIYEGSSLCLKLPDQVPSSRQKRI